MHYVRRIVNFNIDEAVVFYRKKNSNEANLEQFRF